MTEFSLKPYLAHFCHGWHMALNNRSDISSVITIYMIVVAVFASVYRIMPVHELGYAEITAYHLMWYVAATELVIISANGNHRELGMMIADGQLTTMLRRPVHMVGMVYARVMGETAFYACVLACIALLALRCVGGVPFPMDVQTALIYMPLFAVSFLLSMTILMVLGFMVGFLEVYGPYSRSASWIVMKIIFTFGGLFFPVLFFPDWLQTIVYLTPGPAILFVPGQFMLEPGWADIVSGLAIQILWLFILTCLCALIERRITRHVLTVGD